MSIALKAYLFALATMLFLRLEVNAEELDSMRLFFEPLTANAIVNQSIQSPVQPEDARVLPHAVYLYNGFMSSEVGKHFIINGTNLSDLKLLELVLVSDSGRTLKLRTSSGYVFTLAVGEAMTVDPKLVRGNRP